MDFISENASSYKIRKTKRLPVSGAFHTPIMQEAAEIVREQCRNLAFMDPRIPIYSNFDTKILYKASQVSRVLPRQLEWTCKWEASMVDMFKGYAESECVPRIFECGPGGGSLGGILNRINGKAGRRVQSTEF